MLAEPRLAPSLSRPYPPFPAALPGELAGEGRYRLRFASTPAELDAILRLRFQVFNLELGEGLAASFDSGRDEDEFDLSCHHLLLEERATGEVVGTYRLQAAAMAATEFGLYTASEFDLSGFPPEVLAQGVEVGRACVARAHRKGPPLLLLWRGLAAYLAHNRKRFLFGCCSLTSQDPEDGWRAFAELEARGALHSEIWVPPLPGFECAPPAMGSVAPGKVELPALFEIYLRYGGKVCSPPVLDRRFQTLDFLVLLDAAALDGRARRMFFREQSG